jgi:hypothetical protein
MHRRICQRLRDLQFTPDNKGGTPMAENDLFNKGLEIRRDVLGKEYVDGGLAKADDFMMAFQRITTEWCWGYAWGRDGLDRKTRSMLARDQAARQRGPRQWRQRRGDQGNPPPCHGVLRHSGRS